jgi:hypothetical protein
MRLTQRKDSMAREKTRGSFDPEAASKAARARWDRVRSQVDPEGTQVASASGTHRGEELDVENASRERLIEIANDPKAPHYAKVRANEILLRVAPEDEAQTSWQRSAQVCPDYRPPMWDEVLAVARAAGAVVADTNEEPDHDNAA